MLAYARGEAPAVLCTRRRDNRSGLVLLSPMGHVLQASPPLPTDEPQTGPPAVAGGVVLVPTARGLRVFDPADLSRPSALLVAPAALGPPRAVWPLADGLVAVHPSAGGRMDTSFWRSLR